MPLADAVLTGSYPLYSGERANLTCNITGGVSVIWRFTDDQGISERVASINPSLNFFPPSDPVVLSGFVFNVSLLMPTSPHLVTQVSFDANTSMNGRELTCSGFTGSESIDDGITLQVCNPSKFFMASIKLSLED